MDLSDIVEQISKTDGANLSRIQEAIDARRRDLGQVSTVLERRDYSSGVLQLEARAYRRKDGGLTERGPYWYYHYREGGRQRTIYVGKSEDPEGVVDSKLPGS